MSERDVRRRRSRVGEFPAPVVSHGARHFKPTASRVLIERKPRALHVRPTTRPRPIASDPFPFPTSQPFGGGGTPAFGAQPQSSVSTLPATPPCRDLPTPRTVNHTTSASLGSRSAPDLSDVLPSIASQPFGAQPAAGGFGAQPAGGGGFGAQPAGGGAFGAPAATSPGGAFGAPAS